MSLFISSFDRRLRSGVRPVLVGLFIFMLVDVCCGFAFGLPNPISRFTIQPENGKVFFLGNSMFRTGFDYSAVGKLAGLGYRPPFDYHSGHYTNFWYLYVTAGFADVKPSLVVWGFRPTYANLPAFRKREPCDVDLFREYWDDNYFAKTRSAELSFAERFKIRLEGASFFFGQRERIRARVTRSINVLIRALGGRGNAAGQGIPIDAVVDGRVTVADLVQRFGSGGAVAFGEQKMVDAGKSFITGERAGFAGSFIPDIVDRLEAKGIRQLVVIFKPVSYTDGPVPTADREFVDATLRYLEERNIPYLDFVDDDRILKRHYADGDHYNQEGRDLLTRLMSAKLREVLGSSGPAPARMKADPSR